MKDKYNIEMDLTYITYTAPILAGVMDEPPGLDIETLRSLSDHVGLVYIRNIETLNQLIEEDMIMPLNDLITESYIFSLFPEQAYRKYTDNNGDLWAVPLSSSVSSTYREYNGDWLIRSGFSVPETINDFYSYAKYIAKNDPDGNGKTDTYICKYDPRDVLSDFEDVFIAFGCYVHNSRIMAYNPFTEQIENAALNDSFSDALFFIKSLVDQGLVYNESSTESKAANPKFASQHGGLVDNTDNHKYGYFLKGVNDKWLIRQSNIGGGLAVLKFTENPISMLEGYFGLATTSPDCQMDLEYGIKGKDYFEYQDYYGYKTQQDDGGRRAYIGLTIDPRIASDEVKPKFMITSETDTISKEIVEEYKNIQKAIEGSNQYADTDLVFYLNMSELTNDTEYQAGKITGITQDFIVSVLEGNLTYDHAFSEYKRKLEEINMEGY